MNKEKWNGIRSFRERYTYVPAPDWYLKSEDEIIDWLIVNNNEKEEKKLRRIRLGTIFSNIKFDGNKIQWTTCCDVIMDMMLPFDNANYPVQIHESNRTWAIAPRRIKIHHRKATFVKHSSSFLAR